ncbi:ABC transporter substrate-binding protein [Psychrobacter lutiphocae]|uniref:ABC transporter substrate-binding protein n=1 Tax=Psychrobacter lutiphocae TaxID=540500 RepID=UPI00387A36ED
MMNLFRNLWKSHLSLATVILTGALLVGCADLNNDADEVNETTETNIEEAELSQSIDITGLAQTQHIVINNTAEPESLDPHKISAIPEGNVIRQMFIGLVETDRDGKLIPGMAKSWKSADNKVWIFKLRNANWSNGDPVTAEDFVYSWRRLIDPKTAAPYASYLVDAKVAGAEAILTGAVPADSLGVEALDAKTLKVTLTEPVPYFPEMLIYIATKPVPQKVIAQYGNQWTAPENIVVNGPYTLSEWLVNDKIVLTRNPNYFDNANTYIEQITLLPLTSLTTGIARYRAGEVDVISDVPLDQFETLKTELGDEMQVIPRLCTYYYKYNTAKPPFNDVRVRRALALALDRDIITNKVMGQGETPAYQLTPPITYGIESYTPQWKNWSKQKRIDYANKLLNDAGYNQHNPLEFELLYNTSDNHKKIAIAFSLLIKEAFGDKVMAITLVNKEWKTYLDIRRNGKYDIARSSWCGDYNEPSSFLNTLKTGNSNNHGKYSSPQFDSLMTQTLGEGVTVNQRAKLYQQAEAQLDADMPNLNIFHYVGVRLVKPHVVGFSQQDPLDMWQAKDLAIVQP